MEGESHEQDVVVRQSVDFEASIDALADFVAVVASGEVDAEFGLERALPATCTASSRSDPSFEW